MRRQGAAAAAVLAGATDVGLATPGVGLEMTGSFRPPPDAAEPSDAGGVAGSADFRAAGHSLRRERAWHRAVARRTAASPGALPVSGAGARRTAATRSPR